MKGEMEGDSERKAGNGIQHGNLLHIHFKTCLMGSTSLNKTGTTEGERKRRELEKQRRMRDVDGEKQMEIERRKRRG